MSKNSEGAKAHSVLNYMISKAVLEGAESAHEIKLSLQDLQLEHEDGDVHPEPNNIVLRIKIQATWDTSNEIIQEKEFLGEENDDEENPSGSGTKNTPSH